MRRLRRTLVWLLLIFAAAVMAAYAGRRVIADYSAHIVLESENLADARFDVAGEELGEVLCRTQCLEGSV